MGATEGLGAWSEIAYVSIWKKGEATGAAFAALTETIDIDQGGKDTESMATLRGGRVLKNNPQGDIIITFEGYPLTVGGEITGDATGTGALFQGGTTWPTGDDRVIYSTHHRDCFMVSILWTDDQAATVATGTTATNTNAYRYTAVEAICTSMQPSFTDGVLKVTWTLRAAPFNKANTPNIREESVKSNGTTGAPLLLAYNETNFPSGGASYTWE